MVDDFDLEKRQLNISDNHVIIYISTGPSTYNSIQQIYICSLMLASM